jgi:hypothetical protein
MSIRRKPEWKGDKNLILTLSSSYLYIGRFALSKLPSRKNQTINRLQKLSESSQTCVPLDRILRVILLTLRLPTLSKSKNFKKHSLWKLSCVHILYAYVHFHAHHSTVLLFSLKPLLPKPNSSLHHSAPFVIIFEIVSRDEHRRCLGNDEGAAVCKKPVTLFCSAMINTGVV